MRALARFGASLLSLAALAAFLADPAHAACARHRITKLPCHDGDPRCDLDGACDGTCMFAVCRSDVPVPDPPPAKACAPKVRLCTRSATPWSILPLAPGQRYVQQEHAFGTERSILTDAVLRCRPKRGRCTPPASTCSLSVDGAQTGTFPCRAFVLSIAGHTFLNVVLTGAEAGGATGAIAGADVAAPGVYAFDEGTAAGGDGLDNVSFGLGYQQYFAGRFSHTGSARLQIDEVGASPSPYHAVHGSFDATVASVPSGANVAHVHATF